MTVDTDQHTLPLSKTVSLRLYTDTRPQLQHIASLQKGMILVVHGREVVGEGTGFGVPVVRYCDVDFFSGSSTVYFDQSKQDTTIIKQFSLNVVPEKTVGGVKIENKILLHLATNLASLYQRHKYWRRLLQQQLVSSIRMQTHFVRVKSIGAIVVSYQLTSSRIHITVDWRSLESRGLQKIFILNEQSSQVFRKYRDSHRTFLVDDQIGEWERVDSTWASLSDVGDTVGFLVWTRNEAVLRRGREFQPNTLDWVGLDYELLPTPSCFEYDLEFVGSDTR